MNKVTLSEARHRVPTEAGVHRMFDGLGTSFWPVIYDFIRQYEEDHTPETGIFRLPPPPLIVDVVDHLRLTHKVPDVFGRGIIRALLRRGWLGTAPNGYPAFRDYWEYGYCEVTR